MSHVLSLVIVSVLVALVASFEHNSIYVNVSRANITESLIRIKSVPLKFYEYKYDNIPGRRQIGVIGPDIFNYFPESVEIVPRHIIPSLDRSKPSVIIQNFPVIDKNIIFMHGIAAVQELILRVETLFSLIDTSFASENGTLELLEGLRTRVSDESNDISMLNKKIFEMEETIRMQENKLTELKEHDEGVLLHQKLEDERTIFDHESELLRSRLKQEEELAKLSMNSKIELEIKLMEQREAIRHATHEKMKDLERSTKLIMDENTLKMEKEKILAEIEANSRLEKENEQISLRRLQLQAKLDTERIIHTIQTISKQISRLVADILSKPEQIVMIIGSTIGLLALFFAFRELVQLLRSFIQAKLGKPLLVRETSFEWTLVATINLLFDVFYKHQESFEVSSKHIEQSFADVILGDEDKEKVIQLAFSTRNTKKTGAPFRHVLLHGPPGTGKTLIARRLAVCSGMDYAVMSGGDVGPLGEDAVNQLHGLFKWASRSRRGLLVFIDEAEAFLSSRSSLSSSEDAHLRHALNALLYQTGTQSKSFMLVLATNRPQDLDTAILDRIDVSLNIGLPKLRERIALLELYSQVHIRSVISLKSTSFWMKLFSAKSKFEVDEDCLTSEFLDSIAKKIEGFSGREISKLMISAQYAMLLSSNGRLSRKSLEKVIETKLSEHRQRNRFLNSST